MTEASAQRTMLQTGASRGIGHATVKMFNQAGWRVLTVSRVPFTNDCPWNGGLENHIQSDLSSPKGYYKLANEVRGQLGELGLHAIVNNAGLSPKRPDKARMGVEDTSYEDWLSVFNVNLFSAALLSGLLLPELKATFGTIVNVTSIAGG